MALVTTQKFGDPIIIGNNTIVIYKNGKMEIEGPDEVLRGNVIMRTLCEKGWERIGPFHWEKNGVTKTTFEAYNE